MTPYSSLTNEETGLDYSESDTGAAPSGGSDSPAPASAPVKKKAKKPAKKKPVAKAKKKPAAKAKKKAAPAKAKAKKKAAPAKGGAKKKKKKK